MQPGGVAGRSVAPAGWRLVPSAAWVAPVPARRAARRGQPLSVLLPHPRAAIQEAPAGTTRSSTQLANGAWWSHLSDRALRSAEQGPRSHRHLRSRQSSRAWCGMAESPKAPRELSAWEGTRGRREQSAAVIRAVFAALVAEALALPLPPVGLDFLAPSRLEALYTAGWPGK